MVGSIPIPLWENMGLQPRDIQISNSVNIQNFEFSNISDDKETRGKTLYLSFHPTTVFGFVKDAVICSYALSYWLDQQPTSMLVTHVFPYFLPELASKNVKELAPWKRMLSNTVLCRPMTSLLTNHGTRTSHCTCSGRSGTATANADTTVWWKESRKGKSLD